MYAAGLVHARPELQINTQIFMSLWHHVEVVVKSLNLSSFLYAACSKAVMTIGITAANKVGAMQDEQVECCSGVNEAPAASQHASGLVDLMNPGGGTGVDPVFQTWSDLWNLDLVGDEDKYYNTTEVRCLHNVSPAA